MCFILLQGRRLIGVYVKYSSKAAFVFNVCYRCSFVHLKALDYIFLQPTLRASRQAPGAGIIFFLKEHHYRGAQILNGRFTSLVPRCSVVCWENWKAELLSKIIVKLSAVWNTLDGASMSETTQLDFMLVNNIWHVVPQPYEYHVEVPYCWVSFQTSKYACLRFM